MRRDVLANSAAYLQEQMRRTVKSLADLSPKSVEIDGAGEKDLDAFAKKLAILGPNERAAAMLSLAELAGHENGESVPCPLCRFMTMQRAKGVDL